MPLLGLTLLTLLTGACGGGARPAAGVASITTTSASGSHRTSTPAPGGTGSAGTGTAGATGHRASALAYAQCMRRHGITNFPDPNAQGNFELNGGLSTRSPAFAAADKACRSLMSKGSGMTPAQQAAAMAAALKFSQCMRAHGVPDFPDPQSVPGGGIVISVRAGSGAGGGSNFDPGSPQFQAAQNTCRHLLPGGGPKGGAAG